MKICWITSDEKQELWDYIWKNPYDKPKEIQMFCGGSLSTIRKYQKIIQRRLKEKGQQAVNSPEFRGEKQ